MSKLLKKPNRKQLSDKNYAKKAKAFIEQQEDIVLELTATALVVHMSAMAEGQHKKFSIPALGKVVGKALESIQ